MKIIIVSGPSGSGKTTLSNVILKKVNHSHILSTDNYYKIGFLSKLLSILVSNYFDRKISFNYKLFKKDILFIKKTKSSDHDYLYNFEKKTIRKFYSGKRNIDFLIIEGIFSKLLLRNFTKENCLLIEIQRDKSFCMKRVVRRDVFERGKTKKQAEIDFLKSWEFYYRRDSFLERHENHLLYTKETNIDQLLKRILTLSS